jgi:hypothetical protein
VTTKTATCCKYAVMMQESQKKIKTKSAYTSS